MQSYDRDAKHVPGELVKHEATHEYDREFSQNMHATTKSLGNLGLAGASAALAP